MRLVRFDEDGQDSPMVPATPADLEPHYDLTLSRPTIDSVTFDG